MTVSPLRRDPLVVTTTSFASDQSAQKSLTCACSAATTAGRTPDGGRAVRVSSTMRTTRLMVEETSGPSPRHATARGGCRRARDTAKMRAVLSDEVALWSTTRQAAAIRSRELSAHELLELYTARIERLNPAINAI